MVERDKGPRIQVARKDTTLGDRVTSLEVRMAVAESDIEETKKKLDKIESYTGWTVKLVAGTLIVALINLLMKGGLL